MPDTGRVPLGRAPWSGAQTELEQKVGRQQRDMMAGCAIDLHEVAPPEILDPRQVKGLNSGLCSWNALETFAGFVTAINVRRP
jgi:hypothetical protein